MSEFLMKHQKDAVKKMHNGCILNGGVGTGKSRTALYYYFMINGGSIDNDNYIPMTDPCDLYIITTAKKRNSMEWEMELAQYMMSSVEQHLYSNKIVIDSWNNIQKYDKVEHSFFIFDEDRVTGKGAWVKSFYKISANNKWIILSATPGDTWEQYIPVFLANGFYRNKTEFLKEHCVFSRYTKYPQIERYINIERLIRLRNRILVDMEFKRTTHRNHVDIYCDYDIKKYKDTIKSRWDIYKNEPIQQASVLCGVLRRIVNEDPSRITELCKIIEKHDRTIIFYNFDYELDILEDIAYNTIVASCSLLGEPFAVAQWNGHKHQEIPKSKRWIYLVQYNAGCEGWNCIDTDTIVFYSQNYSYKVMEQACGRIDRMNTGFKELWYYHLKSRAGIDVSISKALATKKNFNEQKWINNFEKKERKCNHASRFD